MQIEPGAMQVATTSGETVSGNVHWGRHNSCTIGGRKDNDRCNEGGNKILRGFDKNHP